MPGPLVHSVVGEQVAVVNELHGDVVYQLAEKPASEFILPFDLDVETRSFVGRDTLFEAIDAFAAAHDRGYVEIAGQAGLGKTALAAELARRKGAIVFLASAGRGTQRAQQFLSHVSAELITRHLPARRTLPADAGSSTVVMVHLLAEAIAAAGVPIWIVVDALDEAESPPPGANPLLLPSDLPAGAFSVVTRRTGMLVTGLQTPVLRRELHPDDAEQAATVERWLRARAADDPAVRAALDVHEPPMSVDDFVHALATAANGNFAYLTFVLADLAEAGAGGLDLRRLPHRLTGYYDQFWARMGTVREQDWPTWAALHQPVLERLAVAAEAVTADWLADQIGRPAGEIEARVLEPWARLLGRVDRGGRDAWRLVHRSFADYLADSGKVRLGDAHRAIADVYLNRPAIDTWDGYGIRHAAAHLAETAALAADGDRDRLTGALAGLVTDRRLQERQIALGDPTLLERDLERACAAAAAASTPEASAWIAAVALDLIAFRRTLVRPEALFAAAERGNAAQAERLLDLLGDGLDPDWRVALELTIAWLAAAAAPADAAALRDRAGVGGASVLAQLRDRVSEAIGGGPAPLPPVDDPPQPDEAREMVDRLDGVGIDAPADGAMRELLHASGGYMSAIDGPRLVALAVADPDTGGPLLDRYIELHAAYGYEQYRSSSLWHLLAAVLADPDAPRARARVGRIGLAVLAPVRGECFDAIDVAVLARQAMAGDTNAGSELDAWFAEELATVGELPPGAATAQPGSGREGDVWAIHRRRLAALAEAAIVRGRPREDADKALDAALNVQGGFAGFTAPAYLTLAEAAAVAGPRADLDMAYWFHAYAERAAQNIRDPVYCARVVARVIALAERWSPAPGAVDPVAAIDALGAEGGERPAALHVIGRPLDLRGDENLPVGVAEARTLRDLAELYRRPLDDFLRLNVRHTSEPDTPLPDGTPVDVPDPGLAPLLAARLAGAILAAGVAQGDRLIRQLVLVARADATALATTLARGLLAMEIDDPRLLDRLRRRT